MNIILKLAVNILLVLCKNESKVDDNLKITSEGKNSMLVDSLLSDIKNITNSIEKLRMSHDNE